MSAESRNARIAGLTYLVTIGTGVYAEALVRGGLFVRGDAGATTQAIFAAVPAFRLGLVADLAMLASYIVVTILLHAIFRKASPILSATAAGFSLIGIAVLACNTVFLAMVLRLQQGAPALAHSSLAETVYLLMRVHGDGYKISLVFFGGYCLLLGWMIWRGRILPRAVGLAVAAAGLCNLINSLAWLGMPEWAAKLPPYFTLPTLLGELALAVWLALFGIREAKG